MLNWIDEQVQIQRFEDMARTAQRDHMANQALSARLPRMHFYGPILARLGCWLELYGYRLQRRYGMAREVAIITDSRSNTSRC